VAQKVLTSAEANRRPVLEEQLQRLYNTQDRPKVLFVLYHQSALSLTAIKSDPKFWNEWIDDLTQSNPTSTQRAFLAYLQGSCETRRRDDDAHLAGVEGALCWISGQLDPRLFTETDIMIAQAEG